MDDLCRDDLTSYTIELYDLYLMQEEKRGISYGEIAHIESLSNIEKKELADACIEALEGEALTMAANLA